MPIHAPIACCSLRCQLLCYSAAAANSPQNRPPRVCAVHHHAHVEVEICFRYMHALTGGKASWFDAYLGALETRARDASKPVHAVITDVDAAVVNIYGLYLIMQESLVAAAEM